MTFAYGTVITLSARPNPGSYFAGWTGVAAGSAMLPTTTLTLREDRRLTAAFAIGEPAQYQLQVNIAGSGQVVPTSGNYPANADLRLTARPRFGSVFNGWSGDVSGQVNPIDLRMDGNKVITASFSAITTQTFALSVGIAGAGTVSREPDLSTYDVGTPVTLQAHPNSGWFFRGWQGDAGSVDNPLVVLMDAPKTITATFDTAPPVTYTLSLATVGQGTVTPPNQAYVSGTVIILAAWPEPGWAFERWSGDLTGAVNPTNLLIDRDKQITATFQSPPKLSDEYLPLVLK